MKKTVIFDVDGTLLDTERIYMEAWREAGARFGYTVTDEVLIKTRALQRSMAISIFRSHLGEDFPFETIQPERVRISERIIAESTPDALWKPHVRQVLDTLKARGYTVAVASTTPFSTTRAHLEHAGLLEYFPVIVTGDMVRWGKPEPDIFLEAARRCGSAPEDCIVVGDTPADVFAGSAAGMDVYLIPDQVPANPETTARSRRVLAHLGQLPEALEE